MNFLEKDKTLIMGILNITPDSFSDGGLYYGDIERALNRVEEMINEGVDIIDIGGESTRPGSTPVEAKEELKRVLPIIEAIRTKFGQRLLLSIDTYKAEVAETCLKAGANLINSIGGFTFDSDLADVIAKHHSPIVIYHIKGEPKTMQSGKISYENVISEINNFFETQIEYGIKKGVSKSLFILDPGVGFGKDLEANLEIIKRFDKFKKFGLPLLIGVSRKSHLGVILKEQMALKDLPQPEQRIEAGLAEVAVAVLKGAKIVRTHDILQTKKFLAVLDKLK